MKPTTPHKIVVIQALEFDNAGNILPAPPPPPVKNVTPIVVKNRAELAAALKTLNDGDILVYNGHGNRGQYAVGTGIDAGRDWKDLWKEMGTYGLKKQPKLSCVFLASCMADNTSNNPLTHEELKEFRELFHARIAIAPNYEYESHTGWGWWGKDETLAGKMITDITKYHNGQIDAVELDKRLHQYKERFGITYGCNAWNHPASCPCGFGLPKFP
ncbi:hypothetical protein G9409_05730 [Chlorobium sp. BLA1]|uniref:hypothetical protein n=1 Tax=Candidatus Chlorobium masyuteum TaxID=2716876 RepID=UPI00142424AA|nr:hypothetical protein [Candidatus Chlorobium masyuteum]NHQ60092.1 hypothetical protein [Candidatus Chlorobium masyuteum]